MTDDVEALIAWNKTNADLCHKLSDDYWRAMGDQHRDTAAALRALQERCKELEARPTLPDGWVAVPLEPTEGMQDAGRDALDEWLPHGHSRKAGALLSYRAMLSARPAVVEGSDDAPPAINLLTKQQWDEYFSRPPPISLPDDPPTEPLESER